jgi:hypothetical protein
MLITTQELAAVVETGICIPSRVLGIGPICTAYLFYHSLSSFSFCFSFNNEKNKNRVDNPKVEGWKPSIARQQSTI